MARGFLLLAAVTITACTANGGFFSAGEVPAATSIATGDASARRPVDDAGLAAYLDLMRRLIEGDPLTQANTFREAADAADYAPTTTNRLKFALALATPGHPASNPELAEERLSALLAAGQTLLPEERALATIHLHEVEQRLMLDAAAEQLRRESAAALEQQNAENEQRLQEVQEENRQMRADLEDATEKLNALTNIEQSIRERENGPD
jgi:hypothetical protein